MALSDETKVQWSREFLTGLSRSDLVLELFDHIPAVSLFVKDCQGRYVRINQTMAEAFGRRSPEQILGKTDFDFFPPAIAARYVEEDQKILASLEPIFNRQNFMPGPHGLPFWFNYSKIPLFDRQEKVVAVAGVKYSCETNFDSESHRHHRLYKAIRYVTEQYAQSIEVANMAEVAGLSVSQLQRDFKREFGINPNRYIQEVRIGVARHLLRTSHLSMSEISERCGYYDQAHFSHQFKASTGLSPLNYRSTYFRG
jgi:AraC-like DNA-binding protein